MKRRSIRSFNLNTEVPSTLTPHLLPMARPSPRLSSERKSRWGR
jgi:hypothetical protein